MAVIYTANEDYQLGSGFLKLSVTVGNGQYANTLVKLDTQVKAWGIFPEIILDTVQNCKDKKLFLEINATDSKPNTQTIPITVIVKDDINAKTYSYTEEADVEGGTVLFNVYINLV